MSDCRFTRRIVLQGALVSVTAIVFPGCFRPDNDLFRIELDGQFFDAHQLTVLNDVAEIMIPRTQTPGAADAHVASVIDALMLTWASKDTKARFPLVLDDFDTLAIDKFGKSYAELPLADRTAVVEAFDEVAFSEDTPADADGYRRLKKLIFHVFYTSEEASKDYVAVPGQYHGDLSREEYESLMMARAHGW